MKLTKELVMAFAMVFFSCQTAAANALSVVETDFAFGSDSVANARSIAPLSDTEMASTEGEWLPVGLLAVRLAYTGYRAYSAYRTANTVRQTYRTGRAVWGQTRSWHSQFERYKGGGFGWNVYPRQNTRQRVFAIDWHPVTLNGSRKYRIHYHRKSPGSRKSIGAHRPWQRGW